MGEQPREQHGASSTTVGNVVLVVGLAAAAALLVLPAGDAQAPLTGDTIDCASWFSWFAEDPGAAFAVGVQDHVCSSNKAERRNMAGVMVVAVFALGATLDARGQPARGASGDAGSWSRGPDASG